MAGGARGLPRVAERGTGRWARAFYHRTLPTLRCAAAGRLAGRAGPRGEMTWGVSSIFTILIAIASQTRPRFVAHKENKTVREDRVPMQYRMMHLSVGVLLSAMLHMPAAQAADARCAVPIATFASIVGHVEAAGDTGYAWHSVFFVVCF